MPKVTRLRDERRGRVAVELDGAPWRTLPVDVVVRAGLAEGRELDRPALRLLRQELRRAEALAVAGRALRRRDLSERGIAERLARASVAPAAVEESLAVLARAGLVDDARFARTRADSLAERGYGDAAIRHDLGRQGVARGRRSRRRSRAWSPRRSGPGASWSAEGRASNTARYLASKGFGEEALEAAAGADFAPDP